MGATAIEHAFEEALEILVDFLEDRVQPLAPFAIQMPDRSAQLGDRRGDLPTFGIDRADLSFQFRDLLLGAQIDGPHLLALFPQPFQPPAQTVLRILVGNGGRLRKHRVHTHPLQDSFRNDTPGMIGLLVHTLGTHRLLPPSAQSGFRPACCPIGLLLRCLGNTQRFGSATIGRLGGLQRVQRLLPPGGDHRQAGPASLSADRTPRPAAPSGRSPAQPRHAHVPTSRCVPRQSPAAD